MANIYFCSDTHYYHHNVIRYSSRPYSSVEEMNEQFILNWNRVVRPEDTLYHLGDFAFCDIEKFEKLLNRLNGKIHVILGNHDKVIDRNRDRLLKRGKIKSIQNYFEFKYEGQLFVLFHYGMRVWHHSYKGSILVYGHSHGRLPPYGKSLDVGVDSQVITSEYRPVSIKEIIKWAESIKHEPFKGEVHDN